VFADDVLVGFHHRVEKQYREIKQQYARMINITGHELITPVVKFAGIQVSRNRKAGTITAHQSRYIDSVGEEYKGKFEAVDMPHGKSKEERKNFDGLDGLEGTSVTVSVYLGLVGKLVWVASTVRPDIAMSTSALCACMQAPNEKHYQFALRTLGYLVQTKHLGITFGGRLTIPLGLDQSPPGFAESGGLHTYHDSSWGSRPRPLAGYVIMFCNGPIMWSANFLKLVPDSTKEAETAIAARAAKDTCFARELAKNNKRKIVGPTAMMTDNKALYQTIDQDGSSRQTRHYERATLLVKRAVLIRVLKMYKVDTKDMLADIFTKATDKTDFYRLRNVMMNCVSTLRDELKLAISYLRGAPYTLATKLVGQI